MKSIDDKIFIKMESEEEFHFLGDFEFGNAKSVSRP